MSTPTTDKGDPFRLGWRYVREVGPDGVETTRQVPLTERDLLFPQEEDFVVQCDAHTRDMLYLREALGIVLRTRPAAHVFADHRIDFNLDGVEPLGPDVAAIDDVGEWDGRRGTLYLRERGRPLVVVEVTSPDTRGNDLGVKRGFYERAGVPVYVLVDRQAGPSRQEVALLVLRLDDDGYHELAADDRGRVRLPQLGIRLGLEDQKVWVYQRDGRRIEEMADLYALAEEWEREAEANRRALAEAREAANAQRDAMEATLELEIDLRKQEGRARREAESRATDAESRATDAESRATEASSRATLAETRLQQEAESRRLLEQRLRELEEQLRQKGD